MPVSLKPMDENLRNGVENYLAENSPSNIYILGDLEARDERISFRVALSDEEIVGVMATFEFPDYPIIWIIGDSESAEAFSTGINLDRFVIITEVQLLPVMQNSLENIKFYHEDVMRISPGNHISRKSHSARKVDPSEYMLWARSLNNGNLPSDRILRKAKSDLKDFDCFGYFLDGSIVSRGVFYIKSSYGWAIGAVYTLPEHRGNGYAGDTVSAMVEYAEQETDSVILFVRSDNEPALRSYRKIGFEKVGDRLFIDRNTGQVP